MISLTASQSGVKQIGRLRLNEVIFFLVDVQGKSYKHNYRFFFSLKYLQKRKKID